MSHSRRSTAAMSEADRAQALARYQQLRPALEDGVPLAHVVRDQQIPLRTAQRWVAQYRTYGLAGLIRAPRADRGQHRRIVPELQRLIEGLALQRPPPSAATIHRRIGPIAREHGWPVPSYSSVYGIIQQLDPALITLAHHGPKVYAETFDLIHRREAEKPNEIWQADHTPLDVWLISEGGQPIRPWLTIIEDDYSRAIAGYYLLTQAPSILHTALALRQAIWHKSEPHWHICGIPQVFYTDHGSDFTSRHLEQVAADLKIELIFSTVDMPRGRGKIERLFETINQLFLCEVPGYTPPGAHPATPRLTVDAFEARFRTFLLERYQQRPHGETGMAPQARWEAGGFLPHLPESLEQLDLLLLTVARTRRVQQDGIRLQGLRYGPPGVGKTLSARHYLLTEPAHESNLGSGSRTILYTPTVSNNPGQIARDVQRLRDGLRYRLGDAQATNDAARTWPPPDRTELILVDEADRLKMAGIEQMRDIYDRSQVGLVLIGMPGIEKRLARYPQLYSRVGFVHAFRPLGADETRHILARQWPQLGLINPDGDFTDAEALAAIIRITGGNFRLLHRLCTEIQRILQINELQTVTKEVVETARETLVIGPGL